MAATCFYSNFLDNFKISGFDIVLFCLLVLVVCAYFVRSFLHLKGTWNFEATKNLSMYFNPFRFSPKSKRLFVSISNKKKNVFVCVYLFHVLFSIFVIQHVIESSHWIRLLLILINRETANMQLHIFPCATDQWNIFHPF